MKLDSVTVGIMTKIAEKHGIPTERVFEIVKGYYGAIHHVGKTSTSGVQIQMENLGKLVYSTRRQQEVEKFQENYQLLKGI